MGSCCSASSSQDQDAASKPQDSRRHQATALSETLLLGTFRRMEDDTLESGSMEIHEETPQNASCEQEAASRLKPSTSSSELSEKALRLAPLDKEQIPKLGSWGYEKYEAYGEPVFIATSGRTSPKPKSSGFMIDVQMLDGIGPDGSIIVEYC
ncbi:hypothetical protein D910_09060 [Dendroctonus ponderosae]